MEAKTKIQKKYIDYSLGFPIVLLNAPMIKVRGEWVLKINYNDFQNNVLSFLARKNSKLTGDELQFIRKHFQMTTRKFGKRFSVKHTAVIKWAKAAREITNMSWTTEKDIRLFILDELKNGARDFQKLYRELKEEYSSEGKPLEVNMDYIIH